MKKVYIFLFSLIYWAGSFGQTPNASLPFPIVLPASPTTVNTGNYDQVTYSYGASVTASSSTYTNCTGYTSGNTLRIGANATYFEIYAANSTLNKIELRIQSNSTTAAIALVAFSPNGTTYTNFSELTLPSNSGNPSCLYHIVTAPAGMKYVRIARSYSTANFPGSTYTPVGVTGQTIRIFELFTYINLGCTNPVITGQPASPGAVCSGSGTANFTVAATGTSLTYKWQEWAGSSWADITDGGVYSGSTTTTLTLTNPTAAKNGYKYRCNVSSTVSCTVATDGLATLTVNSAAAISGQSTATATYGQGFASPAPLTVTATGTGLTYQWYSSTDAVTNTAGDDIALGTTASQLPSTVVIGTLYYYCVVNSTACPAPVTSLISGAINIVTACTAPTFSVQPTNNLIECIGGTLSLGPVTADQSPTYQWFSNSSLSNVGGTSVGAANGGNTDTYTPPSATAGIYFYYCVATNGACPTPSNAVQFTVDAPAITGQSTAGATYSLNGTATALTVTATGQGLTYQWYSSTDAVTNTSGDDLAVGTAGSYTPLTTVVGTLYYYCVVSGTCPAPVTSSISGAIVITQYLVGDFAPSQNGNWGSTVVLATCVWKQWNGTAFSTVATAIPTAGDNVWIPAGISVNVESSGKNCKNLVVYGTLTSSTSVSTPSYININGNVFQVNTGGFVGKLANPTGDLSDGISINLVSAVLTINGTGGSLYLSRFRTNAANTVVTLDRDMTLNYHGSTNQGGHTIAYYPQAGDNSILNINAGRTLTFSPWAALATTASGNGLPALSMTVNVNGTLTLQKTPTPNALPDPSYNSYIYGGTTSPSVFTLNVNNGGVVNTPELYPNGLAAGDVTPTGNDAVINVATGGILNADSAVDLRKTTQLITGGGTFNLGTKAKLRIGSVTGITASGASGNIQTAIRNFPSDGYYEYAGAAAQVTGNGLPSGVGTLQIKNAAGVTLTAPVIVTDSLRLTTGNLTLGSNSITTPKINGGSSTSYVVTDGAGALIRNIPAATGSYDFPIGYSAAIYRPANINFTTAPTAGTIAGRSIAGAPGTTGLPLTEPAVLPAGTDNISVANNDYWEMESSIPDGVYTATFTGNGQADVTDFANTTLIKRPIAGNWSITGTHIATTGSNAAPVLSRSGLTGFSQFGIGSGVIPLPLLLLNFNATVQNNAVNLFWNTSTESNLLKYEIERSANGNSFNKIGSVAARNSATNQYQFNDALATGTSFYRLRIISMDGAYKFSKVVAVSSKQNAGITVFPNPTVNELYITHKKAGANARFEMMAADGAIVMKTTAVPNSTQTTIAVNGLPAGNYVLTFKNGETKQTIKFVKSAN